MQQEQVILVNQDDQAIGHASKEFTHLVKNIRDDKVNTLHRAFSVFLFNSKGELLLQQRAKEKITFPLRWTNTCCSHPLWSPEEERDEKDHIGVKRAARRKLEHELGIPQSAISLDEIHHLTRIYYKAESDGEWGEHEVDHVLFIQKDLEFNLNKNEVEEVKYVDPAELRALLNHKELTISPWCGMICENFLFGWWKQLDTIIANKGLGGEMANKIHKLVPRSVTHGALGLKKGFWAWAASTALLAAAYALKARRTA